MTISRHFWTFALVLLLAGGLGACNRGEHVQAAREGRDTAVSPAEQDFAMKATQVHLAEIDMGRMAKQKSQNDDVKDYADMVVKDHTKALEKLVDLMREKNIPQSNSLAAEVKQDMDKMSALAGPDFDREFANTMVSEHQKAIEMFRSQAGIAQNRDIKSYVDENLPTLEKHLEEAQELQSNVFNTTR